MTPFYPRPQGLYNPASEHESCGVGFVCHMKGETSHRIVDMALTALENMDHRGASGADPNSGDGAGILMQLPDRFFRKEAKRLGIALPPPGQYAVGQVFLPQDMVSRHQCEEVFERVIRDYGMVVLGWRDVPVNRDFVGDIPKKVEPRVRQIFVGMGATFFNRADFDRRLYLVRQRAENVVEFSNDYGELTPEAREWFYISLLSARRTVYKGMLTAMQLRPYYPDLSDPEMASALALVHSRFSTNTFPSWRLAHPYRYIAHNGEINTLRGNRNWMRARYGSLKSEIFGDELKRMFPLLSESGSDSGTLDNALQFLCVNGRSLPHAVLMLIPEAWQNNDLMDDDLKAFYEYHACMMEPWDGPASIAFTNGPQIGAVLDRNGLRPSRYYVTRDDIVVMASEVGVLPFEPENVAQKWRLQPGRIFLVDMQQGKIIEDAAIKKSMVDARPWRRWLNEHLVELDKVAEAPMLAAKKEASDMASLQRTFGYSVEDLRMILQPMATAALEPVGSMGADTPLACLSDKPQLLYQYFRQLFAQVTNPPLDAIREELVTSLNSYIGRQGNLLSEVPENANVVKLTQPILTNEELAKLKSLEGRGIRAVTLSMLFDPVDGWAGMRDALEMLCQEASAAVRAGASIVILSDRGVDADHCPIPSLLATSAVHHHLVRDGSRTQCGLVIETGEAREGHHACLLMGYGAGAVNPWLAMDTVKSLCAEGVLPADFTPEKAKKNFIKAVNKSMLKIASKMGISTIQSYTGAQIFEAVGLSRDLVDKYFTKTVSRIEGVNLEIIAKESLARHRFGFQPINVSGDNLDLGGFYKWRVGGEYHMWNPQTIANLQQAVRSDKYETFQEFSRVSNDQSRAMCTIRGLLDFRRPETPIPLEEVEPASQIARRFVTGAMSFGSISKEAHETLAIAMNRLGGKSNTGEGGEDPGRFTRDANGDLRRSAIKQVASARFGVTVEYLVNADELQIKMAQGAKPGEGGQLPGDKVDEYIAKVRHSTPGVQLISPPPHHDIYSIEDLAQLIHDLKNVNSRARVSVKLVSEVGVGTVAAGVAKAKADHILISGDSGGTGASPLSSIKYAGLPWELGIAETQQTLVLNNLRGRVTLQTDGQIKTGRDVVVAALLGAEEIGFSTAPLIAAGCLMMRACHLNTCPVGIATQDPELRKKFVGKPEHVVRYMMFVAEEVRGIMAELGIRKFDDLVGRADLLKVRDLSDHWKARHVDLSVILFRPDAPASVARRCMAKQDHGLQKALDNRLIELAKPALENKTKVVHDLEVKNINRTVGAMLSGEVARKYGQAGLPEGTIHFRFKGSGGQSFGAFLAKGITLELEGDSNDYVGKGISGGKVIVYPPKNATFRPEENIIAGNVICYGAIDGEVYLRGVVGERFCVRNSGAQAVVEGCGDHGCEYMTGGRVVIIGPTGRNFAAGMSGGVAYVYDPQGTFPKRCNMEMVALEKPTTPEDIETLRKLLSNHVKYTGSSVAKAIMDDFDASLGKFVKVLPNEYRKVLQNREAIERRANELSKRQTVQS